MKFIYECPNLNLTNRIKANYSKSHLKKEIFYNYLISIIRHKTFLGQADDFGFVHISTKELDKVFINTWISRLDNNGEPLAGKTEHLLTVVRNDLKRWGVLKTRSIWDKEKGIISKVLYKLDYNYLLNFSKFDTSQSNPKYVLRTITGSIFNPSILKDMGICHELYKTQRKFYLDVVAAKEWVIQAYNDKIELKPEFKDNRRIPRFMDDQRRLRYLYLIENFDDHWLVPARNGRITTNLNTLPSELREFIVHENGSKTVEVDISSSQPLMIGILIKKMCEKNHENVSEFFGEQIGESIPKDVRDFIGLNESGQFYEYMKMYYDSKEVEYIEDVFKTQFFSRVLFDQEKIEYKFKEPFRELFPSVSRYIIKQKKELGNDGFSVLLQRTEAEIIQRISKRLLNESKDFFTIHDGFRVEDDPGTVNRVKEIIAEEFKIEGVQPTVK